MTHGAVGLTVGHNDPHSHEAPETTDNLAELAARFERGEFDLFACGRSLLNDPAWARKARLGLPFERYDPSSLRGVAR
jgi:2,4-dienoyl-CoA reductase-like NADH-dependent reductase (Old Yellow Enzyme family)